MSHYREYVKSSYRHVNYMFLVPLYCITVLMISTSSIYAQLQTMCESEMKDITAQSGLATFTMSNNTAQLFIDIHIETYATINTLAAGHYDNSVNGEGWDLHWNNICLGDSMSSPLTADGFLFIANFDDINSNNRKLERIVFGFNRLQGTISADMQSFTGMYNSALVGGSESPVTATRSNLGQQTFSFNSNGSQSSDQGLFFILNMSGNRPNVQVVAGYDSKTLTAIAPNQWWVSP